MYVNCHIKEISIKATKITSTNEWEHHIALTQLPLYTIYRRDEIPCKKGCNDCAIQFDNWMNSERMD